MQDALQRGRIRYQYRDAAQAEIAILRKLNAKDPRDEMCGGGGGVLFTDCGFISDHFNSD